MFVTAAELNFGAFVNVAPHPNSETARDLVRGGVGAFAHFSGMQGSSREAQAPEDRYVFERLHANYDRANHTLAGARHAGEHHAHGRVNRRVAAH